MNAIVKGAVEERLPDIEKAFESNKKSGRKDLIQRNVLSGYEQASLIVVSLVREGETNLKPHVARLQEWHKRLLDVEPFEFGNILNFTQSIGEMGYLLNQNPHKKELEFVEKYKENLDGLSAIAWNLYTGKAPDENLPGPKKGMKKHEQLIAKYVELLLALLHDGDKALKEFDKHYIKREKSDTWHSWHGGGPRNPFYLDPLALCILKYRKPEFDSDSIHMKGYRTLVAAGY